MDIWDFSLGLCIVTVIVAVLVTSISLSRKSKAVDQTLLRFIQAGEFTREEVVAMMYIRDTKEWLREQGTLLGEGKSPAYIVGVLEACAKEKLSTLE